MSLNRKQFEAAIREVLATAPRSIDGDAAVRLLLGTAAQESGFGTYLKQISGPACGVFQIEPTTAEWLEDSARQDFKLWLLPFRAGHSIPWALKYHLDYSIAMCRMRYLKVKEPIPHTLERQAAYWKQYHNTAQGKGTIEEYISNYKKYIGDT